MSAFFDAASRFESLVVAPITTFAIIMITAINPRSPRIQFTTPAIVCWSVFVVFEIPKVVGKFGEIVN
ncbi:MAG: hypothetical protein COT25_00590 [Candidatus Kerfeldbacteria bacterium CG08_land_8_20_14_0_20_42_7]|uniref:Uncharacterized protein n=1 Tax=Candidatus Kerfeldbacteria bacterium CG08_land_8_20_14_0_20_42_7 TaxID=2014245 RepID=A0A2H0YVY7_9BACT|nr:MAG: hypothetical protein COT25_00590 [Candidatus Kerfeldbacteria bacterium CG08_land_8_20_14_0_20_42_7]